MGLRALSVLWGVLEATLFFIVPDVLLSFVAVHRPAKAMKLSLWVVFGSLLGGTAMYFWGLHYQEQALAAVNRVPAISVQMVDGVAADLQQQGLVSTVFGAWRGMPYKIYAVQASGAGFGLLPFLLISVPARLLRFLAICGLAAFIGKRLPRGWDAAQERRFLGLLWVLFYAGFFCLMPG